MDANIGTQNKTASTGNKKPATKKIEPIDGFNEAEMRLMTTYNLIEIVRQTRAIVEYDNAKDEIAYQESKIALLEQMPESKNRNRDIEQCQQAIADAMTVRDGITEPLATSNSAVQNLRMLGALLVKVVRESETAIKNSKTALSDDSDESDEVVN